MNQLSFKKRRNNQLTPSLKPILPFEQLVEEFLHKDAGEKTLLRQR
jgi:hypothetical protein